MANTFTPMVSQPGLPFCRHYFSVQFTEQPAPLRASDGTSQELPVTWALGELSDGDWEVLGAWPVAATGPAFWRHVFAEFTLRGMERISVLLVDAVAEVRAAYSSGIVAPRFGRVLSRNHVSLLCDAGQVGAEARRAVRKAASVRGPLVATERLQVSSGAARVADPANDWPDMLMHLAAFCELPARFRSLIRDGGEVAVRLSRCLNRAIGRHGGFANQAEALNFIANALSRAGRRLERVRTRAATESRPCRSATTSRPSALGVLSP